MSYRLLLAFFAFGVAVAALTLVAGAFLGRAREERAARRVDRKAQARRFGRALDHVLDDAEGAGLARDEAAFRGVGERRLEPRLEEFLARAEAHDWTARASFNIDEGRASWRLEVERPELPGDQPRPFIAFSCGEPGRVCVTKGGVFPGPADHNGHDAEIAWHDMDWDDVDRELLRFAERAFAPPNPGYSFICPPEATQLSTTLESTVNGTAPVSSSRSL